MFNPAVEAILAYHEARLGNSQMRAAAQRAQELGYDLVWPATGDGKYLRLILESPVGKPVTLYLEGSRVNAGAKNLRRFAATLPGAVRTTRDVQFPLATVDLSVLEAFAHRAGAAKPRPPSDRAASPVSAALREGWPQPSPHGRRHPVPLGPPRPA